MKRIMYYQEYVKLLEAEEANPDEQPAVEKGEETKFIDASKIQVDASNPDAFGKKIGITDKSAVNYGSSRRFEKLALPETGPIGSMVKSAWANLNVPTRGIPNTDNGNLGCAAAVSIIFFRATGLPIMKSTGRNIDLGTGNLWHEFTKSNKAEWEIITDWRNDSLPGDIILTSRGKEAGHVGIIIEGGKIISNSSGPFEGDTKGQIELNYTLKGWESVAKRNPQQTAAFRYKGPHIKQWGSKEMIIGGLNDENQIQNNLELPEVVVTPFSHVELETKRPELIEIPGLTPRDIVVTKAGVDLVETGKRKRKRKGGKKKESNKEDVASSSNATEKKKSS